MNKLEKSPHIKNFSIGGKIKKANSFSRVLNPRSRKKKYQKKIKKKNIKK